MKYGTAEYSLNEAKKEIDKALVKLSTVRNEVGTIMEVKNVGRVDIGTLERHYKGYSSWNRWDATNRSHVENANACAGGAITAKLAEIEALHASNLPAIANNLETKKKVCDFMTAVGIPATYTVYEYPSPRHRIKKSITKAAGYAGDIGRCISTDDGYDSAKRSLKEAEERISREYKTLISAIEKAEKEAAKVQEEKGSVMELARFQVKYETTGGWDDVLDSILEKDKYLRLAHYLLKNREDWNDGYSYAECGLNGFIAETPEDKEIEKELYGLIGEGWDNDGRCFREARYGYNYLFTLVNPNLYLDYQTIQEKLNF